MTQFGSPDDDSPDAETPARRTRRTRATRSTADRRDDLATPASGSQLERVGAAEPQPDGQPQASAKKAERVARPERPARRPRHDDFDDEAPIVVTRKEGLPRFPVVLEESKIDPDVKKVVRRLVAKGFEAYLVGGCVRDLMLDRRPKDFDVATSARPEEVREIFRNSRVIGRRFRLVHVLFGGGKVIEVATFRKNPTTNDDPLGADSNLLIRSDNVFGEAHEDALRRDFTINALFYDLDTKEAIDWVGGIADVRARVVNTIGDPIVRFREDPVRILRALKFAGRLELGIDPVVYDAIVSCRDALELAARPRVAEEVLRLMRGGHARRTMFLAWETGVLELLLPELAALLYDSFSSPDPEQSGGHRFFRLLDFVDEMSETEPLDDAVLWTLLLLEPLKEATDGMRDRGAAAFEFLDPLLERLAIPRRFSDVMRKIVTVLPRVLSGKAGRMARTEWFDMAMQVALADLQARGLSREAALAELQQPSGIASGPRSDRPAAAGRPRSVRPRPTPRH